MLSNTFPIFNDPIVDFANSLTDQGASDNTVDAYLSDLALFCKWFEATNGQPLTGSNVTTIDAREWRQHLLATQCKPATVNRRMMALKKFAALHGITLTVKRVEQQALAPKWLDRREQAALLRESERAIQAANTDRRKQQAQRDHLAIVFLLNTGLRVSELCSLTENDLAVNERSGSVTVRGGKGEKTRTVPLNVEARKASSIIPLGVKPQVVQRSLSEFGITPHTLRHTFAKNLIDSGVSIDQVAALLGHENLNTTRIYTTPSGKDLERAVEVLE